MTGSGTYRVAPAGFSREQWQEFAERGIVIIENASPRRRSPTTATPSTEYARATPATSRARPTSASSTPWRPIRRSQSHLTADDDTIRRRMRDAPHEHQVIREADIARLKERFAEEVENSLFRKVGRVVTIDTTGRTPEQSLDEILLKSEPMVTFGELALRALPVPGGRQQVVYRNGVRTLVPGPR